MGVTAFRARSGREARDVINATRVHIAVVDLGLPLEAPLTPEPTPTPEQADAEEAGPRLLELLRRLDAPPPTVVVKRARSHRDDRREIASALRAGAFAVVDRPSAARDLELMLEVLRRCMIRHYRGLWPGT
ncbi:MAG: hypothetical protein RBS39_04395 [Phycisphaerales bacterium]|jgi:DNA-binding response OmpR family regulator|nr:hypothetical protein [Phycisphaerales bacterium]